MNIIEGLTSYKARKGYSNIQLAELLGCSSSVVSLYLSGKSGLSLEEAFGEDVATAIKSNIKRERPDQSGSMQVVMDGLRMLLDVANR